MSILIRGIGALTGSILSVMGTTAHAIADDYVYSEIYSERSATYTSCMKKSGGITVEKRTCLSAEYRRADRQLNLTYKSVMKQLKTKQLRRRLVEVQRVWIWRRDDQCRRRVDESGAKGGTAGDLIYDDCLLSLTIERTGWLRRVPANPGHLTKV